MLIQKRSSTPSAFDRRRPVSVVMARLPRTISLMRVWARPVAWARRYCVMPSGSRNSVSRISPGVIGSCAFSVVVMVWLLSVVVGDLNLVCAAVGPDEADAVLIVDADRVLAGTVADELFQAVAGWHPQAVQFCGGVEQA